ncbi:MAG: hypothetical protein NW206_11750 [Hyphomonadaceae bacterium]|nr:hypothetical protein [Hyphomonadaceae bacterium]
MAARRLDGPAKAQLWGFLVSGGLSFLLVNRSETLSVGPYIIGAGLAWAAWEFFWGRKLGLGPQALMAGLLSGLIIPWAGVLVSWGLGALRP